MIPVVYFPDTYNQTAYNELFESIHMDLPFMTRDGNFYGKVNNNLIVEQNRW